MDWDDKEEINRLMAILYAAISGAALHLYRQGDVVSRQISAGLLYALDGFMDKLNKAA